MEALVESMMGKKPETVDADMTVKDAAAALAQRSERCLVVEKDGFVLGIVTSSDILEKVTATGADPSEVYVKDIMSTPVITVPAGEPIGTAAKIMSDYDVDKLPVVDDSGTLVGIVTSTELARWLAMMSDYKDPALNALAKLKDGSPAGPYQ